MKSSMWSARIDWVTDAIIESLHAAITLVSKLSMSLPSWRFACIIIIIIIIIIKKIT